MAGKLLELMVVGSEHVSDLELKEINWNLSSSGEEKEEKEPGLPSKGSEQVEVCSWELGVAVLSRHEGGRRENVVCFQEQAQ